MPKSHDPLNAYSPSHVPEPSLANSPRLERLIHDGKLYLSLKDAIDLALENNLDLAIARYNLAHRRYRHPAHQSWRGLSRGQYRRRARDDRWRSRRLGNRSAGRWRGRHYWRRGRRRRRCAEDWCNPLLARAPASLRLIQPSAQSSARSTKRSRCKTCKSMAFLPCKPISAN